MASPVGDFVGVKEVQASGNVAEDVAPPAVPTPLHVSVIAKDILEVSPCQVSKIRRSAQKPSRYCLYLSLPTSLNKSTSASRIQSFPPISAINWIALPTIHVLQHKHEVAVCDAGSIELHQIPVMTVNAKAVLCFMYSLGSLQGAVPSECLSVSQT